MKITEIRIFLKNEEKLKAYASITFDDAFVVRNLKIIDGREGLFVSMPNRKTKDGEYKDVAHPVNNEMRDMIENSVLDAYKKELAKADESGAKPTASSFGEFE